MISALYQLRLTTGTVGGEAGGETPPLRRHFRYFHAGIEVRRAHEPEAA
ncbi:MAG TPA: hypothetical protein VGY31_13215 [Terriglobia bacterium]|nr:hypothetical protein [Terriglobia bacterium]